MNTHDHDHGKTIVPADVHHSTGFVNEEVTSSTDMDGPTRPTSLPNPEWNGQGDMVSENKAALARNAYLRSVAEQKHYDKQKAELLSKQAAMENVEMQSDQSSTIPDHEHSNKEAYVSNSEANVEPVSPEME